MRGATLAFVPFALALTALLGLLTLLQICLILGAPLGAFAWGGQHRVLPHDYGLAARPRRSSMG